MTKLTDSRCKNAKATGKIQKIPDGQGLYLHVTANGKKYWRLAYRFTGKQKTLSFGTYPMITLSDARTKRDDAKKILIFNLASNARFVFVVFVTLVTRGYDPKINFPKPA